MSLRSRIRGGQDYLPVKVATAAQFLTLRLIPIGSTHVGCDDSDGPGHAPRYLDVRHKIEMFKVIAIIGFLILAVYISIYSILSSNGIFRPACIGTNGVKWYSWVPYGFVDDKYSFNEGIATIFTPLWYLDKRFWHTENMLYRDGSFDPFMDYRGNVIDGRDVFDARKRQKQQQKVK